MKKILIVGANSAIAAAAARQWVGQGVSLVLAGRNPDRLSALAADLRVRGGSAVKIVEAIYDATDRTAHAALVEGAWNALQGLDGVLIAHGSLPDQKACEASVAQTLMELETNALSVIAVASLLANRFEAQGRGVIAVIGSVAGDRGRQSNYVYGAAKGMVGLFLQGLRNRLSRKGVRVVTIKPGFVDTPMTASFKKGALWASADQVASGIVRAMERADGEVYLPGFWRLIMLIIRHIPEAVFKRMSL